MSQQLRASDLPPLTSSPNRERGASEQGLHHESPDEAAPNSHRFLLAVAVIACLGCKSGTSTDSSGAERVDEDAAEAESGPSEGGLAVAEAEGSAASTAPTNPPGVPDTDRPAAPEPTPSSASPVADGPLVESATVVAGAALGFVQPRSREDAPTAGLDDKLSVALPKLKSGRPDVVGDLDRIIIRKVVNQRKRTIKQCYTDALKEPPGMSGKVVIAWQIDATGNVSEASIESSTLADESVENCLVRNAKTWRFPAPRDGGVVRVKYPFVFEVDR